MAIVETYVGCDNFVDST